MSEIVKKLYAWCLDKVRFVAGAIIAFLPRALPNKKKSVAFLKRVFLVLAMILLMCPVIMRVGGKAATGGFPEFTYTGSYTLVDDGGGDWRIKFLTSGTLVVTSGSVTVDVFLVGGGASGAKGNTAVYRRLGGNGGFTYAGTYVVSKNTSYNIIVGAGGNGASAGVDSSVGGGTSTAFGLSAAGGQSRDHGSAYGGSGGSGHEGTAGSNGSNGTGLYYGIGQGTTTREFAESSGALYAAGGAAGGSVSGASNTGNGGRGGDNNNYTAGSGGSGIVIIRNHRAAA